MEDSPQGRFVGGETAALARLQNWIWEQDQLQHYFEVRNGMLGQAYSSKLSPWLAAGCLSPRLVYWECKRYETQRLANKSTYWLVFELIFRDFFQFQALKQGNRLFFLEGPAGKRTSWDGSDEALQRWKDGRTGWPLVDANMRELRASGFMSNRGRQNVASFLVLEQKVDWRKGAEYFESVLLDHDVASNWGNWCAAAGLFGGRLNRFNIVKQSKDYDPKGDYIRRSVPLCVCVLSPQQRARWLLELRRVPQQHIHEPWKMSRSDMDRSDCVVGRDYPEPMRTRWEQPAGHQSRGRPRRQRDKRRQYRY